MIEFIKNIFARFFKKSKTVVKDSVRRVEISNSFLNISYSFSKTFDDVIAEIITRNYNDVVKSVDGYYIQVQLDEDNYGVWNSNYPGAWCTTLRRNGIKLADNVRPSIENVIKFRIWLDEGILKNKERKDIKSKINMLKWGEICDKYFELKDGNHYSHHTIKRYMDEIIELKNGCDEAMSAIELREVLHPHIEILFKIAIKSKEELDRIINEQKEKERIEAEEAKARYKEALINSSQLMREKYENYCEDFKLTEEE